MLQAYFEPDAGNYTVTQAVDRFVPTLVWDAVRRRHNQLLYGGQGTGKTILLKRLSWPAMQARPAFLPDQEFVGFYCDLRDLEVLSPLFHSAVFTTEEEPLFVARVFTTLHLAHAVVQAILDDVSNYPSTNRLRSAFLKVATKVFSDASPGNLSAIEKELLSKKGEIISALTNVADLKAIVANSASTVSPENFFRLLSMQMSIEDEPRPLGVLLDQYEYMPSQCQRIVNPILKRENHASFFCIVASRPFAFKPQLDYGSLQPGEDFQFLITEHFPQDLEAYQRLLTDIWDTLRPKGPRLDRLLENGPGYFTELSSRSIRRFLNLCETAGALRATHSDLIRTSTQKIAAREISELARDQFKLAPSVPLNSIWNLMHLICEKATIGGSRSLPGTVNIVPSKTTDIDSLDPKSLALIRRAFEEGAIQYTSRHDGQSFSAPARFSPASIVAPSLGLEYSPRLAVNVGADELDALLVDRPRSRSIERIRRDSELSSIFLSISFADLPAPNETRRLFRETFENEAGIKVFEGSAVGVGLIEQIKDQIRKTNATIVELSYLRANVVLEMGITLGLGHRVIPVLQEGSGSIPNLAEYPFLADMAYFNYILTAESVASLRDRSIAWLEEPAHPAHLLETPVGGGSRLRVSRPVKRTMAIYYPQSKSPLWKGLREEIQRMARKAQIDLRFVSERPFGNNLASVFDHLVWCVSRSERLIVDTTGTDGPDLYGAFALGFALGCSSGSVLRRRSRRKIRRIEEKGSSTQALLSMWPRERLSLWSKREDILSIVEEMLEPKRKTIESG